MSRMGLEVSRLRKELGMTQKQLARLVGVSEGFIADIESGKKILGSDLSIKISKALRVEAGKLDLFEQEEKYSKPEPDFIAGSGKKHNDQSDKKVVKVIEKPVQAIWNDALAGVLMAVPIYNYNMDKGLDTKQLPIIGNKVEGFPKDKVLYLKIEDNDMVGFRVFKGDLAFAVMTGEFEKDAIYLIEHNNLKAIRQVKKLDSERLLLVSNQGTLSTEMTTKKDIKILARLIRLEVLL